MDLEMQSPFYMSASVCKVSRETSLLNDDSLLGGTVDYCLALGLLTSPLGRPARFDEPL